MYLRDRLTWSLLYQFQTEEKQRRLKAQYHQWQVYGYSHTVAVETLLIRVLLLFTWVLSGRIQEQANAIIHRIFGIPPCLYKIYLDRYLRFWSPDHVHTRIIVRSCPWLIPFASRKYILSRYQFWRNESTQSPASALNKILDYIESREDDKNWNIHVRNIVEFTIWPGGRVEKPFHLRAHGLWLLKDFPEPKCPHNSTRYAIAASVMEQLVDVFNWRTNYGLRRDYIEIGDEAEHGIKWDEDFPPRQMEEAPEWAKTAPPASEGSIIESAYARKGLSYEQVLAAHGELDPPNQHFLKRNLIADVNFLQFA